MSNFPQPIRKQRKGNFPYKFKITEAYSYKDTGWKLTSKFESDWLSISEMGEVIVNPAVKSYAWDGCTPKMSILNLFTLGVPDGHVDFRTMKEYTYDASLVHDALYQYLDSVPVPKAEIDKLFLKMLGDFKLRWPYYLAVKYFGGRGIVQKGVTQVNFSRTS